MVDRLPGYRTLQTEYLVQHGVDPWVVLEQNKPLAQSLLLKAALKRRQSYVHHQQMFPDRRMVVTVSSPFASKDALVALAEQRRRAIGLTYPNYPYLESLEPITVAESIAQGKSVVLMMGSVAAHERQLAANPHTFHLASSYDVAATTTLESRSGPWGLGKTARPNQTFEGRPNDKTRGGAITNLRMVLSQGTLPGVCYAPLIQSEIRTAMTPLDTRLTPEDVLASIAVQKQVLRDNDLKPHALYTPISVDGRTTESLLKVEGRRGGMPRVQADNEQVTFMLPPQIAWSGGLFDIQMFWKAATGMTMRYGISTGDPSRAALQRVCVLSEGSKDSPAEIGAADGGVEGMTLGQSLNHLRDTAGVVVIVPADDSMAHNMSLLFDHGFEPSGVQTRVAAEPYMFNHPSGDVTHSVFKRLAGIEFARRFSTRPDNPPMISEEYAGFQVVGAVNSTYRRLMEAQKRNGDMD